MFKKCIGILILLSAAVCFYSVCLAQSTLPVSITFPEGELKTKTTKLFSTDDNGDGVPDRDDWVNATTVTAMIFGELEELIATVDIPAKKIKAGDGFAVFGPKDKSYFAIDVAFQRGGTPSGMTVQIQSSGADAQASSIGNKITAGVCTLTYVKDANPTESTPVYYTFADLLSPVKLAAADFRNSKWKRIYVGISIPDKDGNLKATNAQPFSYGDTATTYTDISLIISQTSV